MIVLYGRKVTKEMLSVLDKAQKPQTNADRIRSMTDEELAVWINDTGVICNLCAYQKECDAPCSRETCIEGVAKWLQQPVEEVLADG